MSKSQRPAIENPLASLGLDDIVRGITIESAQTASEPAAGRAPAEPDENVADENNLSLFGENAFSENKTGVPAPGADRDHVATAGAAQPVDLTMAEDMIDNGGASVGESDETNADATVAAEPGGRRISRSRKAAKKSLEDNLSRYTRLSEQGVAIWLPKEVKKKLEFVRLNANRTIPLRALAAAIITAYIADNEDILSEL